ncbi:MAG: signal recognition particle-docking protein FtsY [Candidatus Micrarchaeia archaeon]
MVGVTELFDLLKKKLSSFVSTIAGKKEESPTDKVQALDSVQEARQPVQQASEPPQENERKTVTEPSQSPAFIESQEQRDLTPKLSAFTKIKSVFSGEVSVSEAETRQLFDELEVALLESDVSFDAAQFLVADLKKRIIGKKFFRERLSEAIKAEIALALESILSSTPKIDLVERVEAARAQGRPFVVLFMGPNGAGKTTTIAKIAWRLKQKGFSCVISASDTFRAAALEQAIHHGEKLGVKVIRQGYGADPAAVAFDAVSHAKASKVDVVLVDTAGRQETNANLLKEMEKISRVIKPDLKVFVGEAIAGNALVEQVKEFSKAVGVDALVLTKLDCDAKGGNSISIAFETKLPVLFVGMGQDYGDLVEFDSKEIVAKILAA